MIGEDGIEKTKEECRDSELREIEREKESE